MGEKTYLGGVTGTVLHTETDGTMHVEERQDVEPILDYAAAARNHRFGADVLDGMMRHEAEIPFVVFQEECRKRHVPCVLDSEQGNLVIEAILADPQYAHFRAAPHQRDPRVVMKGLR